MCLFKQINHIAHNNGLFTLYGEWYRNRYRELDWHNRKQLLQVPFPASDQCKHFCAIY